MTYLTTIIGNNQNSNPEEVKSIRKKLNDLGIESGNQNRGYIDQELDTAIRGFQRGMDLKEDGLIKPNGETEKRLNYVLDFVNNTDITPPKPAKKPTQKQPPIPSRKPMTPQEKTEAKENFKSAADTAKNLFKAIFRRKPTDFATEWLERSIDNYYKNNNDPI